MRVIVMKKTLLKKRRYSLNMNKRRKARKGTGWGKWEVVYLHINSGS